MAGKGNEHIYLEKTINIGYANVLCRSLRSKPKPRNTMLNFMELEKRKRFFEYLYVVICGLCIVSQLTYELFNVDDMHYSLYYIELCRQALVELNEFVR